jgi:hypothetical protein
VMAVRRNLSPSGTNMHILAYREHPFRSNVNTYSGAS